MKKLLLVVGLGLTILSCQKDEIKKGCECNMIRINAKVNFGFLPQIVRDTTNLGLRSCSDSTSVINQGGLEALKHYQYDSTTTTHKYYHKDECIK